MVLSRPFSFIDCVACCAQLAGLGTVLLASVADGVTTDRIETNGGGFTASSSWDKGVPDFVDTAVVDLDVHF